MFSLKDNLTCRITVTRPTTGGIGNIPVILSAFITVVTTNVWETSVGGGNSHGYDKYQQTSRTDSDEDLLIILNLAQYAAGGDGGWGGGGLWGR